MSRLNEVEYQGVPGWQWDDGPIFVGEDGYKYAVSYGRAVQDVEDWARMATLSQQKLGVQQRIAGLEDLKND